MISTAKRFGARAALAGALTVSVAVPGALAQGVLRIGMTASDIPLTTGQADNGGEGMRFTGYTVYDGLVNWDLTAADKPSDIVPGLAESWAVDPNDKTKWTFKIRFLSKNYSSLRRNNN